MRLFVAFSLVPASLVFATMLCWISLRYATSD
jgi:hypothetical protein